MNRDYSSNIVCPKAGRALLFCLPHKKEAKKFTTCEKPGLILRAGHAPLASGQGLPVPDSYRDRTTRGQPPAVANLYKANGYSFLSNLC